MAQRCRKELKRPLWIAVAMWVFAVCFAVDFTPPNAAERLRAIGSTAALSPTMRRALDPGRDFEPVPSPRPGDWLAVHRESGQTFEQFVASRPNRPDAQRRKIYLVPFAEFPKDRSPSLEALKECAAACFALNVEILPPLPIEGSGITTRVNRFTRKRQWLTGDILALLQTKLPADAFCLLGITMEDLYPEPSWNFVFGQALLHGRVGIYSFARYDPAFYGEPRGPDYRTLLLRRSCKVLVHETAHMFGLQHCVFFHCLENGSNHLPESDARPLRFCPVCLRKLQFSAGFDVADWYRRLLRFHQQAGFDDEAQWIEKRLRWIAGDEPQRHR